MLTKVTQNCNTSHCEYKLTLLQTICNCVQNQLENPLLHSHLVCQGILLKAMSVVI